MIDYRELRPQHPLASRYIHSYTYALGNLHEQGARHIIRAVPSVMTQFYFEFCGGLSEIAQGQKRTPIERRSYVNPGLGEWMDIYQIASPRAVRPIKNFKVDLYPHALYEVFGLSPVELRGGDVRVEEVWGGEADALWEELEAARDGLAMVAAFEKHFVRRVLKGTANTLSVYERLAHPDLSLAELSSEVGYSQRWLQKRYRDVMGVSYKQLQGNRRFLKTLQSITSRLVAKQPIRLSHIAYENGYFDQAHFIKEFRRYAGLTPSEYLAGLLGDNPALLWEW